MGEVDRASEPAQLLSNSLLEAIVAVGSELDLTAVLYRIIEAAVTLVDASYGALGVIGQPGHLVQFLTVGIDDRTSATIGHLPAGHGILGVLMTDPEPLRLADLTQHPASYGFPANHPSMATFLGVPIRVRGEVFGNLYLTEKHGGAEFDDEDERVVIALAAAAGVAVENARLYDEARRRERWLQASTEVTTSLMSGTDPAMALPIVALRARELAEASSSFIALPGAEHALVVEVADGDAAAELLGLAVSMQGSLPGRCFRSAEAITVASLDREDPIGLALGGPGGPVMLVPLVDSSGVRGVLAVIRPAGGMPFSDPATQMLEGFAAQAAVALQLAEARREGERVVLYEDRDRIARDLHDLVIQRLFASGMQLESMTRLLDNEEAVTRVRHVVDELDLTIREIRSAIYALQTPDAAKGRSLRSQLLDVADSATSSLGFAPSVRFDGPVDTAVPSEVAPHLVAVLVEALSNAARHAEAHRVEVAIRVDASEVQLRVSDDGIGITPYGRRSGLLNLAERALALGGSLNAVAHPASTGTELVWTAPIAQPHPRGPGRA